MSTASRSILGASGGLSHTAPGKAPHGKPRTLLDNAGVGFVQTKSVFTEPSAYKCLGLKIHCLPGGSVGWEHTWQMEKQAQNRDTALSVNIKFLFSLQETGM